MVLSHIQGALAICVTAHTLVTEVGPYGAGPYTVALAGVGLVEVGP